MFSIIVVSPLSIRWVECGEAVAMGRSSWGRGGKVVNKSVEALELQQLLVPSFGSPLASCCLCWRVVLQRCHLALRDIVALGHRLPSNLFNRSLSDRAQSLGPCRHN